MCASRALLGVRAIRWAIHQVCFRGDTGGLDFRSISFDRAVPSSPCHLWPDGKDGHESVRMYTSEQIIVTLHMAACRKSAERNLLAQRPTTNQQLVGSLALEQLGAGASGKLVVGEDGVDEREQED